MRLPRRRSYYRRCLQSGSRIQWREGRREAERGGGRGIHLCGRREVREKVVPRCGEEGGVRGVGRRGRGRGGDVAPFGWGDEGLVVGWGGEGGEVGGGEGGEV